MLTRLVILALLTVSGTPAEGRRHLRGSLSPLETVSGEARLQTAHAPGLDDIPSLHTLEAQDEARALPSATGLSASTLRSVHQETQEETSGIASVTAVRRLRQSAAQGTVTTVQTAVELVSALLRGDKHIELTGHVDLSSTTPLSEDVNDVRMLGDLPTTLSSLTANCSGAPLPPELTTIWPNASAIGSDSDQCVVVTDVPLMAVPSVANLWVDNVFVRFQRTARSGAQYRGGMVQVRGEGNLWMTRVTMQGDSDGAPDCTTCGVGVAGSLYAEGCKFDELDGEAAFWGFAAADLVVQDCVFSSNTISMSMMGGTANQTAMRLEGNAFTDTQFRNGAVLFRMHTWTDPDMAPVFYSDPPATVLASEGGPGTEETEVDTAPLDEWPEGLGLSKDAIFFTSITEELETLPREGSAAAPSPAPAPAPAATPKPPPPPPQSQPPPAASQPPPPSTPQPPTPTQEDQAPNAGISQPNSASEEQGDSASSAETGEGSGSSDNRKLTGLYIGVAAAAVLLLVGIALVVYYVLRHRRRPLEDRKSRSVDKSYTVPMLNSSSKRSFKGASAPVLGSKKSLFTGEIVDVDATATGSDAPSALQSSFRRAPSMFQTTDSTRASDTLLVNAPGTVPTLDTFDVMTKPEDRTLHPPGECATSDDRIEFLRLQLESIRGKTVCGDLVLEEGAHSIVEGGQAVVQFARSRSSKRDYAIKFITSEAAFQSEQAQYTDSENPHRHFLPELHRIVSNDERAILDSKGNQLPPCIIMERGESLDLWMQRNKREMDVFACMTVLHHVCECLRRLHAAGYAHRDLKPGNIMWLPSQNHWTIIDFGCAAPIGKPARTAFTLTFAPPEVIRAKFREGGKQVVVTEAMDAWSLGVVALVLFTGKVPFKMLEGREKAVRQIVGEEPLPWEDETTARGMLKGAARFRAPILSLLNRDPAQRPSISSFMERCSQLLATSTSS